MTQDTLSRRDQFALAAMAKLMERVELSVDQVAAMAALQADVMVKRLDADPRDDEGVRDAPPTTEETAKWIDGTKRWRQRDEPAPADSYETREGVRVRLGEAKDEPQPFKRQVLAAAATMLLDEDSLTVGNDVTDLDGTFVRLVVTSYECDPPRTYGGILRNVPGWETRLSGFLSRARRALA